MFLGFMVSYKANVKFLDIPILHASKVFCKLIGVHLSTHLLCHYQNTTKNL
jgi:hypothetical protein